MEKEKIVLLDTSAIIYRAFYANPHFRTKNEPTGAVYGFTLILQKIIKEFTPKMIGAAFDVSRSSLKRTEFYNEYKAQRDAAPEDLIAQISRIEELLEYYNIKKFKVLQHEADDVLGTLAKKFSEEGYEVIIITGDKDLSQVISKDSGIKIALLGKGDGKDPFKILSTEEDVIETLGVRPDQIPDFFGLIGDTSDGIPGVRKIGPKKAIPMIEKYGNLEGIYENIESLTEIPGIGKSLVTNLIEDRELAFISRKLATIDKNLIELEGVKGEELVYNEDEEKLLEFFKVLEFKNMIKKYSGNLEDKKDLENSSQNSLESLENSLSIEKKSQERSNISENIKIDFKKHEKIVIDSKENFEKLRKEIKESGEIVFYLSDLGCTVSTAYSDYYFPNVKEKKLGESEESGTFSNGQLFSFGETQTLFGNAEEKIGRVQEEEWFKSLFVNVKKVVGYNLKTLYQYGVVLEKNTEVFDVLIGYHLLTSATKGEFEVYSRDFLEINLENFKESFPKRKVEEATKEELQEFLSKRARVLFESYKSLQSRIKEEELDSVMNEIETPLIEVLAQIELEGIKIDENHFKKLNVEFSEILEDIKEKIYKEAGSGERKEFNLNSPKQLAEVLFIDLSLPILKKNKTGPSTDVEVLEELSLQGIKIADLLLEHRKLTKLVQTYIDPLPKLADKKGRIHTSFNQTGTTTGRLSSSNPNLQNIPVKSEEGLRIRKGFVASSGKKLIGIDYSQIELRVLAEMSQDENLVLAYREDKDLHDLTARKIFDLSEESEVTREQRTVAKIVNFSLIYGKTAFGLSKELKIPQKDASNYIKAYFEQYPRVKNMEQETIEFCEENGYVKTLFGRKRWIDGINSKNRNIKQQGERMAVNTVIQGTASEIIKKAMINIFKDIKDSKEIKMILQVHDELIFEVDEDKADFYKGKLENKMREAVNFQHSKLDVNGEVGDNWGETK